MKNIKKLNKKGFTLVELLAIIVILAIILVVTVPAVFTAIDNSRKTALESSAKGLSKWITDTYTTEMAFPETCPSPAGCLAGLPASGAWGCIKTSARSKDQISASDYMLDGNVPTGTAAAPTVVVNTCSAIYNNNGKYEVLLIAKNTGKIYTSSGIKSGQTVMWATSANNRSW